MPILLCGDGITAFFMVHVRDLSIMLYVYPSYYAMLQCSYIMLIIMLMCNIYKYTCTVITGAQIFLSDIVIVVLEYINLLPSQTLPVMLALCMVLNSYLLCQDNHR